MGTRRAHPGTLPTQQCIQKCKHTPLVICSHPTNPDPSTQADTPAPQRSTHRHVQSHTATSSLQKPTHSPVASPAHSCTHIHIKSIHRHAQAEAQSYQHIQTHTHIFRNVLRCRKAHLQLHQPPGVAQIHSILKRVMYLVSHAFIAFMHPFNMYGHLLGVRGTAMNKAGKKSLPPGAYHDWGK